MNIVRSMTDFIDSVSVDSQMAVYNEEYTWAEEYAEYYNESSNMYVGNILESSGYQFFGEACFIQEAHKGLIAGGILALVSGALFMIMKLLNGGGGSSSSNKSSKSSSKSSSNKSSNTNFKYERDEAEKKAREEYQKKKEAEKKAREEAERKRLDEIEAERKKLKAEIAKREAEREKAKAERAEKKAREEAERKAEYFRREESTFGNDEASINFNPKIMINRLKELKEKNAGNLRVEGGNTRLNEIRSTLEKIEGIVDNLNRMINENKWDVFSHSSNEDTSKMKDGDVKDFILNYQAIDNNIANLRKLISGNNGENVEEIKIDDLINFFKDIESITKQINKKCKAGIAKCKEEHKRRVERKATLIEKGQTVSADTDQGIVNVKNAYKILNHILKEINQFCEHLENVYEFAARAKNFTNHITLPFAIDFYQDTRYFNFRFLQNHLYKINIGTLFDNIESSNKHFKSTYDVETIKASVMGKMMPEDKEFYVDLTRYETYGFGSLIKDVNDVRRRMLGYIQKDKENIEQSGKDYPELKDWFLKVFGIFEDFYNVSGEEWIKVKSVADRPEGKRLTELTSLFQGPIPNNVAEKTANRYLEKLNKTKMSDISTNTQKSNNNTSSVDAFVDNMPAISFKSFYEALKREADGVYGVMGAQDKYNATWFNKKIQEVFKSYEKDPNETKFVNDAHSVINGYLYEADSRLSDHVWKRVEDILDRIGYKSINAKVGDDINLSKKYWKIAIPAKNPGDKTPDTIKHISQMPRVMKINIDGDDEVFRLDGKYSYWGY